MIPSLQDVCTPRSSVFNSSQSDTVYRLDELNELDAPAFFEENFVTSGMKTLLTEVFSRLDKSNPDANGAFLLSQSMGGGKTHSLLALGLLAKHPEMRQQVMGFFYNVTNLDPIKVVTFNGRENPEFGVWGLLAERLGRSEVFSRFYTPLRAPGESDWIQLLQGDDLLILLDEIPPYLNQSLQVSLGQSTLAHATQSALSNLLSAINSGKLPNVTLVLTDLSGASYSLADDRLVGLLGDMENEAERTVQRISPVRLDTPELYDILRTRLFESIPESGTIDTVAAGFRNAIEEAGRTLDVPTDRASDLQTAIRRTYPFHPSMQDIFARFRENSGYQQTRALIRILRLVVADLWTSGQAGSRHLIGVDDIDPDNARLASELEKINDRFGNAIAHDIARQTGDAVAQSIDTKDDRSASHVARLILMSSLSLATDPVHGLTRTEIVTYLASPGRNIGNLNTALDALIGQAWYLHATADGRILFRTTENVRAKLDSSVGNVNGETVRAEISKRVEELFKPALRDVYQHVEALPDLKNVTNTQERTTLIIARPESTGSTMLVDYYNSLSFKNRVLFITGREPEYETLELRARYLIASAQMVRQFEQQSFRADDPQLLEARDLVTRYNANFYQALQSAFFTLLSPASNGLLTTELNPQYGPQGFSGESMIRDTLIARNQYVSAAEMKTDSFRQRVEKQLWPQDSKQVAWTLIRAEAAQQASFPIHQPSMLDDVRMQAVMHGYWRMVDEGKFVERGPFEAAKARVAPPKVLGKPDPETGAVTLQIDAVNADQVKFISATGEERLVQGGQITLTDLAGSFVAIDSTGEHQSEAPIPWKNTIAIKYDEYQDGDVRRIKLQAVPPAQIRYTTDGSSPQTSGNVFTSDFVIGNEATKILVRAEASGVTSFEEFNIPARGTDEVRVDPMKPALWKRSLETASTVETFTLLEQLQKCNARIRVKTLAAEQSVTFSAWGTDPSTFVTVAQIRQLADLLVEWHEGWPLRIDISAMRFEHGADLLNLVRDRETKIGPQELEQPA